MSQEKTRFLSYICPRCRQSVIVEKDVFALAASPTRIQCPCGHSELDVEFLPQRVRLKVPCLYCGREHLVSCSSHAFLREKALAFSCAQSGLDCCYVGEEGPVYAATARLEQALDKLEDEGGERGVFLDEMVMEEVLSEIRDIAPGTASPAPAAAIAGPSRSITARWTSSARSAEPRCEFLPPPPTTLTISAARRGC